MKQRLGKESSGGKPPTDPLLAMAAIPCMVTIGKDQHGAWNRQRRRTFVLFAAVGQLLQQAGVAESTATPQKQRRIMIGDVASGV